LAKFSVNDGQYCFGSWKVSVLSTQHCPICENFFFFFSAMNQVSAYQERDLSVIRLILAGINLFERIDNLKWQYKPKSSLLTFFFFEKKILYFVEKSSIGSNSAQIWIPYPLITIIISFPFFIAPSHQIDPSLKKFKVSKKKTQNISPL
jgi:hypothetical protein